MNKIQEACAFLIFELYDTEPCGGDLHIITDDGNLRDSDIEFCEKWIAKRGVGKTTIGRLELVILQLLLMLSVEEREELYEYIWKYM